MHTIRVNVGKGYDINIGEGLLGKVGELVSTVKAPECKAVVITDSNVAKLYLFDCQQSLRASGFDTTAVIFDAGEESKTMSMLGKILEGMAEKGVTRNDIVIALGGGVTGDMAGFAAGVYMRGIPFVQVPTTLLAAVDSSVGGKTAVDLPSGKNLAGLFYQPEMVICDTLLLETLPEEEYKCGLAEAIKTGILSDEELFGIFEEGDPKENLPEIIARCAEYKAGVVMRDEKEKGERKLLNLGHTAGHAIEKLSNYEMKHGFAVAIGLGIIGRAASRLGYCSEETAKRIENALLRNGLPVNTELDEREIAEAALSDKKRSGKTITIAVPISIGNCDLKEIETDNLEEIIMLGKKALK